MACGETPDLQPDWQRRSLAVMVTDVVGYSRLMESDEAGTHTRMRRLRVEAIDPCIVSHRGEVIKNTGDGFLACFESPGDAVRCARELQAAIGLREQGEPPERRIQFRIGVNLETVIVDERDVFGSGVNIASRLQTHSPAGGLAISESVKAAMGDELDLPLEDLGDLHLKNITRPVRAFAMPLAGSPGLRPTGILGDGKRARPPTLAVLPLRNLGGDEADGYFAEGVIEDLIVSLTGLHDLFVISRGSVLGFEVDASADEVSGRLGVRYVLDGTVRRDGVRLRFTFRLCDASTGSVAWAERYDCVQSDLFDLQRSVLDRVIASIAAHVRGAEIGRAQRKPPDKLDAYDYLLQALGLLYRLDFPSFARARALLAAAIEADPHYAAAHSYAAQWHVFNVGQGWSSDPAADASEALRLSDLARERDPFDGLAHSVHGHALGMLLRDYDAALEAFELAMAASPGSSWAWLLSSATFGFVGKAQEGVERAEWALRLSPIDRHAFFFCNVLAQNHYLGGNHADALVWSRKALRQNGRFAAAARLAAASFVALDRLPEARQVAAHLMRIQPRFTISQYATHCPFQDPEVVSTYLRRLALAGFPP